jgi:hypothetical protein
VNAAIHRHLLGDGSERQSRKVGEAAHDQHDADQQPHELQAVRRGLQRSEVPKSYRDGGLESARSNALAASPTAVKPPRHSNDQE